MDKDCIGCTLCTNKGKNKAIEVNGKIMLKCIICGELKPENEFYKIRSKFVNRFGDLVITQNYDYRCKSCIKKYQEEIKKKKGGENA